MQKITPFLWFDHQAEEAVKFYTSIFKNSKTGRILRYSEEAKASGQPDRKSTRLNSSHLVISYAVFCLKKKKELKNTVQQDIHGRRHPEDDDEHLLNVTLRYRLYAAAASTEAHRYADEESCQRKRPSRE